MSFKVNNQGIFVNSSNVRLRDKDLPCMRWGDDFAIVLVFPNGTLQQGDKFALAVDTDRFLGNGLCALSEDFTLDVATQTVSFAGVATNTQKMLSAVNGKPGCVEGQIQVTRYVNGDISQRVTILDDRCMMKGLVYVNGATVYILDPNAAYTKEQVDAIFATAVVFQFSADGVDWHDEQSDDDFYLRFRNPAVETSSWSNPIRFMRSDIVPLVTRAENAATNAERQAENAAQSANAANAAKNAAVEAKGEAEGFTNVASQMATAATENANAAVLAKNAASHSANAASNAANAASNSANDANNAAVTANNHKNTASDAANRAAGSASDANQSALDAKDAKDKALAAKNDVQTMKQDVVDAANTALNSKIAAVNAANTATAKASEANVSAQNALQSKTDAKQSADKAANAKNDAVSAKNDAVSAKTDAVSAKNDAVSAKTDAVSAKNDAVSAKNDAVSAKNDASAIKNETQALHDDILQVIQIPVGHAYNVGVTEASNVVSITWTDPTNNVTEDGATIAYWKKTRLIYKVGGFPENENDGTVLCDNEVRNQYRSTPYTFDMGVTANYCFALFSCTTGGVWNTSDSAPRFTINYISFATIRQMLRSNIPLSTIGLSVGGVVNIQTSSRFPALRWKLVDENYHGCTPYDNTVNKLAIFIPQYLPCEAGQTSAIMSQFDAPEYSYAITDDTVFSSGKVYCKLFDNSYVALVEGTDWNAGDSVSDWSTEHSLDVYTKNHSNRVNYGNNNWKDSNRRQWMNATGSNWFQQQNIYDKLSTYTDFTTGMKSGFDSDFLELIMPVYIDSARNTIALNDGGYGGGKDTTLDTFWMPSITEVFGSNNHGYAEGQQFDYFANYAVTSTDRIQRDEGGTARNVFLRSANTGTTNAVYYITTSGTSSADSYAYIAYAFLPAMCIA